MLSILKSKTQISPFTPFILLLMTVLPLDVNDLSFSMHADKNSLILQSYVLLR